MIHPFIPYSKISKKRTAILTERRARADHDIAPPMTSQFEFKAFKDLREMLTYLNLASYSHLFSDKGMTHFTDFYLLSEDIMK